MGHIFISYSHKDTAYAHKLASALQKKGLEVWIDERLDYGSQWPHEIQKQLDACSAFIVIMSPRSFASEWVQSELQRAKRKLKPVFPMLLEGDEPWLSVESTQYYDVRKGNMPDEKFFSAIKRVATDRVTEAEMSVSRPEASPTFKKTGLKIGIPLAIVGVLAVILVAVIPPLLNTNLPEEIPTQTNPPPVSTSTLESTPIPKLPTETTELEPASASETDSDDFIDGQGIPMRLIPAGEFTMGRSASAELAECLEYHSECQLDWFVYGEPVHTARVDAFYIDLYEVTNARYKTCVDEGACEPPQAMNSNTRSSYYDNPDFEEYPVVYVNWFQAQEYCAWRGGRLPTEAEWEKAARGTDGRTYPWGEGLDVSLGNFNYNVSDTTPVGSYEDGKSPYGLYDMAGNVWEWVVNLNRPYPYTANDGRESLSGDGLRLMRGGSWGLIGVSVSTSYRYGLEPTDANPDLGIRCARDASP